MMALLVRVVLCLAVSCLGYLYSSTLFENDRFFSHLSELEREMTFRTEAGFYYMFYKRIVQAPSFLEGWGSLVNDTGTEYPYHINTLQRFDVYPEVALGGLFRLFRAGVDYTDTLSYFRQCYTINRGASLDPVASCVGAADLSVFYTQAIFLLSGLQLGALFLVGCYLGDSELGGLLTAASFLYNYTDCTRVQWIPPLRESFSIPFLSLLSLLISIMLKEGSTRPRQIALVLTTVLFALPWQFSQFVLLTTNLSLFGCYVLLLLPQTKVAPVLDGLFVGYCLATLLQYLNTMLLSSLYVSSYLAFRLVLLLNTALPKTRPTLRLLRDVTIFLAVSLLYKTCSAALLDLSDDAHIFNILRAKFTDFRDFHTLLYICSKAFDFIGFETFYRCVMTLLIPTTLGVLVRLGYLYGKHVLHTFILSKKEPGTKEEPEREDGVKEGPVTKERTSRRVVEGARRRGAKEGTSTGAAKEGASTGATEGVSRKEVKEGDKTGVAAEQENYLAYHVLQFICYLGMAIILMRLKLFMTPYMCMLSSLTANNYVLPQTQKSRYIIVFLLLGAMSITGSSNISSQLQVEGEYNNPDQEQLFHWIDKNTDKEAVFAGPMPVMANLRLSTGRRIINHPHYEDAGLRDRTKQVYQMYSRKSGSEVHATLRSLGAQYAILDRYWCTEVRPTPGCAIPQIWDYEDKENRGKETFCKRVHRYQHLFHLAFSNDVYRVLKLK